MITNPKISVVTVVYNDKIGIDKTIQSVLSQTYDAIEYIIIDGGSTDGTLEIIKKYKDQIDYWVSEKDKGIYDAMNKGIDAANGDFIIFMNSNDTFYADDTVEKFAEHMTDDNTVYFGRAKLGAGKQKSRLYPSEKYTQENINKWLKKALPNHQAMFFPKIFYKLNYYNLNYPIGADSDYKFESVKQCRYVFIDKIVSNFILGGVSSEYTSWKITRQVMKDSWKIVRNHRGVFHSMKRQITHLIKYILKKSMSVFKK